MTIGSIVKVEGVEYVYINEDGYELHLIESSTGRNTSISISNYKALINKEHTDKTYKDLPNKPLWIKVKIYEALELQNELQSLLSS